jgi:hypothetical protein
LSRVLRGGFRVFPKGTLQINQKRSRIFFIGLGSILFAIALVGSTLWESTTYFGRQANSLAVQAGFNLTENGVAKEVLTALKDKVPVYLSPKFYEFSPVRYLVYGFMKQANGQNTLDERPYSLIRPDDTLPIPDPGKDALFLLDTDYAHVMDYFRVYYPNIEITETKWAGQLPLYLQARVPKSDFAAIQGVSFRATDSSGKIQEGVSPTMAYPAGLSSISKMEWEASLQIEHSGVYQFPTQADLQMVMDGKPWTESRNLCSGLHRIQVIQSNPALTQSTDLLWIPPNGEESPIPPQLLFRINPPQVGLTGTYYQGADWQGEPVCVKNTPFFRLAWPNQEPVASPFSAMFRGFLRVTQPGSYRLVIRVDDGARLTLDGKMIGEELRPNQPNAFEAMVELAAGDHPIQIDYFQTGGGSALVFNWQPPGQAETLVPSSALIPEKPG